MKKDICAGRLRKLAKNGGVDIGAADAKDIVEQIRTEAKSKINSDISSRAQAYGMSVQEFVAANKAAAAKAAMNAKMDLIKFHDLRGIIDGFDNPIDGFASLMSGSENPAAGSRKSLQLTIERNQNMILNKFVSKLEEQGVYEAYRDPTMGRLIAKEVYEPGSSGNTNAQKLAKIIEESFDETRSLLNAEGANIGKLNEYLGRQIHKIDSLILPAADAAASRALRKSLLKEGLTGDALEARIQKVAFERWRDTIEPRLDWVRTKDFGNREQYLKDVYEQLVYGNHEKIQSSSSLFKFQGPANLAKRASQERSLHFKDGDAWFQYNETYGSGAVQDTVAQSLARNGHALGMLEMLGTNPRSTFDALKSYATRKTPKNKISSNVKLDLAENQFKILEGKQSASLDNGLAKAGVMIRAAQRIKTVYAPTWVISESAAAARAYRAQGLGPFQRYVKAYEGFLNYSNRQQKMQVGKSLLIMSEMEKGQYLDRFLSKGEPGGAALLSNLWFKANLSDAPFINQRLTVGTALSELLDSQRGRMFKNLDGDLKDIFPMYGIGEAEWNLFRKTPKQKVGEYGLMHPESVYALDDAVIAEYLKKPLSEVSEFEIQKTKRKLSNRLYDYFIDRVDYAVNRPKKTDSEFLLRGTKGGTYWGEAARYWSQFKDYSVSMTRRVYGNMLFSKGKVDYLGFVEYAAAITIGNALRLTVVDLLSGKKPRDFTDWKNVMYAYSTSGAGTAIGEYLFNEGMKPHEFGLRAFFGPSGDMLWDTAKFMKELATWDEPGKALLTLGRKHFNPLNLWYTKAAIDYAVGYRLGEFFDPGYTSDLERRLENNTGQEYFLPPSDFID